MGHVEKEGCARIGLGVVDVYMCIATSGDLTKAN
jgi:hypothetical protein